MRAAPTIGLATVTVCAALAALAPATGSAQAGIRVYENPRARVDGSASEWSGAAFASVGEGSDASMRFALGYDADALYVVAEVRDDRIVRSTRPGAREDAVILTLATGPARRRRAVDFYLFAGVAGRGAASAGTAPVGSERIRPLGAATVVEGPLARGAGYTLEARIPFSAIPGGRRGWEGAVGSIRLRDVDSEAHPEVEAEPSFVEVDRAHLDRLVPLRPTGGASGALEQFLTARGMGAAQPSHDLRGDVLGDGQEERVFVVNNFVVVSGPGVPGGGYAYHELPVERATDVRSAELRDLTGDGKEELVLVLRQRNPQGERDVWQVFTLANPIRAMFGVEVRKAIGRGTVEARVRIVRARRRGTAPEIEVSAHRASGLDASSYRERDADDAEPMLVPWGPVRSRRYRWSGRAFARTGERANPRYRPPAPAAAAGGTASGGTASGGTASGGTASGGSAAAATPAEPPAPDADALLATFRRERRIGRGVRPRFSFTTNLAGGAEPETAHVYGRQLVVVGPGIQGGRTWMFYEAPVTADADLLDVRAADVTGDRRAEILFRVRQRFGEVVRELLVVHQLTARGFPQILQIEVARVRGEDEVRNEVVTAGGRLEVRPGQARGFSASHWPFERDPSDSAGPLLLPWQDRPVRYRLRGGRLTR